MREWQFQLTLFKMFRDALFLFPFFTYIQIFNLVIVCYEVHMKQRLRHVFGSGFRAPVASLGRINQPAGRNFVWIIFSSLFQRSLEHIQNTRTLRRTALFNNKMIATN